MIKVAGYCRVSTDHMDQLNSFESQRLYFHEYIHRQPQWELYAVYADEGVTGTSTAKRTQFNQMIQDAYNGKFQLIITKEVSRFSRNLLDTIAYTRELKAIGVGVFFMNDGFISTDPDAELRLSIMGSIAQEESRKTSSRVKWGQTRQMERGVVFGRSLLGYDVKGGKISVNPEGAELVRLIFQKYTIEGKGTTAIARELQEAGCKTVKGNSFWQDSAIVRILRNEKYAGDLIQKKTITPDYLTHKKKRNMGEEDQVVIRDHHTPIIDRTLWELTQQQLQCRNRKLTAGHSKRYLFSGKIVCGECGSGFIARCKTRKNGTSYRRWACSKANRAPCKIGKQIRDELAEEALKDLLRQLPIDKSWVVSNLEKNICTVSGSRTEPASTLREQLSRAEKKKEACMDAFLSGHLTAEEMKKMKGIYDQEISALQNKIMEFDSPKVEAGLKEMIESIMNCAIRAEPYYKTILQKMIAYKDGRLEILLQHLPHVWTYQIEYRKTKPECP